MKASYRQTDVSVETLCPKAHARPKTQRATVHVFREAYKGLLGTRRDVVAAAAGSMLLCINHRLLHDDNWNHNIFLHFIAVR